MKDHWLSLRGSIGNLGVRSVRAPGCTTTAHTEGRHLEIGLGGSVKLTPHRDALVSVSGQSDLSFPSVSSGRRRQSQERRGRGEQGHRWPLGGEGTSKRRVHWQWFMVCLTDLFLLCTQFSREPLLYMKGSLANKVITFSKYVPLLFL